MENYRAIFRKCLTDIIDNKHDTIMGNYTEWIFQTPEKSFGGLHCMECGNYKSCCLFNSLYNGINNDDTYIYPQFAKIQCQCYKIIFEDGITDFEDNLSYRTEEFTDIEERSSYHSEWTSYYDFSIED